MNQVTSFSALGFSDVFCSRLLKLDACGLERFSLPDRYQEEGDVLSLQVFFEKKEGQLTALYYEAALRKALRLDSPELTAMDMRMSAIDWNAFFEVDFKELKAFQQIHAELSGFEKESALKEAADWLRVKHWEGTELGDKMKVHALRSRFEICQRFYFLPGGSGITLPEAFRFLNNRWMQKKQRRKKANNPPRSRPASKKKK